MRVGRSPSWIPVSPRQLVRTPIVHMAEQVFVLSAPASMQNSFPPRQHGSPPLFGQGKNAWACALAADPFEPRGTNSCGDTVECRPNLLHRLNACLEYTANCNQRCVSRCTIDRQYPGEEAARASLTMSSFPADTVVIIAASSFAT